MVLRPWTLLNNSFHPEAAASFGAEEAGRTIRWVDPPAAAAAAAGVSAAAAEGSPSHSAVPSARREELRVPLGLLDTELRDALKAHESVPLLRLESAESTVFGGFADAADGAAFEEEMRKWVIPGESRFSGTWCCTHSHYQAGTLLYKNPAKLPSGEAWAAQPADRRLEHLQTLLPARQRRECYWDGCRPGWH